MNDHYRGKLCYRSKLRYVSAAEKLLYAVSSLMICVLLPLCGGFDRIYRKWNFDGEDPLSCYVRLLMIPIVFLIVSEQELFF